MTFEDKIRLLRKQKGYSQEDLASLLGVSRQAISKWERGALPDIENLKKLSEIFECSIDYLVKDDVVEDDKTMCLVASKQKDVRFYIRIVQVVLLVMLAILWILSKTMPFTITQYDTSVGMYFVGLAGFIKYYNLTLVANMWLALWIGSICIHCYVDLKRNERTLRYNVIYVIRLLLIVFATYMFGHDLLCAGASVMSQIGWFGILIYMIGLVYTTYLLKRNGRK